MAYAPSAPPMIASGVAAMTYNPFDANGSLNKETERALEAILKEIVDPKIATKFRGCPPEGSNVSLNYSNEPIMFMDKVTAALRTKHSWEFPIDRVGRYNLHPMPCRDSLSAVRVELLRRLLPERSATMFSLNKPGEVVTIPQIDGSICTKPIRLVTGRELMRMFIREVTQDKISTVNATRALKMVQVQPGESWDSVSHRVEQLTRASMVVSHYPYLVEETYFYRTITRQQLHDMCRRFIGAVAGKQANRLDAVLASFLPQLEQLHDSEICMGPTIMSPSMVQRGILAQDIYRQLVKRVLLQRGDFYIVNEPVTSSRSSNTGVAAISNTTNNFPLTRIGMKDIYGVAHLHNPSQSSQRGKRPLNPDGRPMSNKKLRVLEQLSALQEEIRESEEYEELQDHEELQDGYELHDEGYVEDDQLAAVSNKPASKPGRFGTPYLEKKQVRSFASPRRRTTPTTQAPQQAVPTTNTTSSLPRDTSITLPPLPDADADISQIRQALRQRRICFYYAFGTKCPYESCYFDHGQSGLPFGSYRGAVSSNREPAIAACQYTQADYNVGLPDLTDESL